MALARGNRASTPTAARRRRAKQHDADGMVSIRGRVCSYDSCTKRPFFNIGGNKTAAYCKEHAEDGMVNTYGRQSSHGSCTRGAALNIKGS